jgi:hypothetical protein
MRRVTCPHTRPSLGMLHVLGLRPSAILTTDPVKTRAWVQGLLDRHGFLRASASWKTSKHWRPECRERES